MQLSNVARRIAAWLVGNLVWTILSSGFVGALLAAILKNMGALSNPYGLVAIALLVAALCVATIRKVQKQRAQPEIDSEQLTLTVYNALREERERAAQQIAKEEVDRELKRFK
jgi:hypothetical protein